MNERNYDSLLSLFIQEIKKLKNPSFVDPENWTLCDDLLNGVSVGTAIEDESDRKLLHQIGQKYKLIPLCDHEVVGFDRSDDGEINFGVVETDFGRLKIEPRER